jgi:hypothetical protein
MLLDFQKIPIDIVLWSSLPFVNGTVRSHHNCGLMFKVSVFFVDYGNSEDVAANSLLMLSHDIRSVPHMAQHFRLHGLQLIPGESERANQYMKSNASDKIFRAKFFKGLGGMIPVELIDDENHSLNRAMEESGLLKKQGMVKSCVSYILFSCYP